MNQIVDAATIASAVPIPVKMTRREKLLRWANLIRESRVGNLVIYHGLEYWDQARLDNSRPGMESYPSAFTLAAADPQFREQGLIGTPAGDPPSIGDTMRFFELTQPQLHEFSCDCGGVITNEAMAQRIERLA